MNYIIKMAARAHLLIIKGCHLCRCEAHHQMLSDIVNVLPEKGTKRPYSSGDLPPAKRRANIVAPVYQLGQLASSAQLAFARAAGAGASVAAARDSCVVVDLTTEDECCIDLTTEDECYIVSTTEDESQAVAVAPCPAISAPATFSQVVAPLAFFRAAAPRPLCEAANAQLALLREKQAQELHDKQLKKQKLHDKQLKKQKLLADKAAASASFFARRKVLSDQNKQKKVVRKSMERQQKIQKGVGAAAGIPETTTQDAAGATQEVSDAADILESMRTGATLDVSDAIDILESMRNGAAGAKEVTSEEESGEESDTGLIIDEDSD